MLNPALFKKLEENFGAVKVAREDEPGDFTKPKGGGIYGVENEETYLICCPVCEDENKLRLGISYLSGQTVYVPSHKKPITFSKKFKCFHKECQRGKDLRNILWNAGIWSLPVIDLSNSGVNSKVRSTVPFRNKTRIKYPRKTVPVTSPSVPDYVTDYIRSRGFDPVEIEKNFGVQFIPSNTYWEIPDEIKDQYPNSNGIWSFGYDRLLIPIVGRRKLAGWQSRRIDSEDPGDRYETAPGTDLSSVFYNMDEAKLCRGVIIVEGPTDVWRASQIWEEEDAQGDKNPKINAVGLLGKGFNSQRIRLASHLWGADLDWGCLMLDGAEKDPSAPATAAKISSSLYRNGVFPAGFSIAYLNHGDPSDYTPEQLWEFVLNSERKW